PGGIRQTILGVSYFLNGGVFPDWYRGALPLLGPLARDFAPDVVLATFGNTDTWRIAQRLARIAGCPWIGDVKDPWGAFVPAAVQRGTARRFADMAHMTALSAAHAADAARWFQVPQTV